MVMVGVMLICESGRYGILILILILLSWGNGSTGMLGDSSNI